MGIRSRMTEDRMKPNAADLSVYSEREARASRLLEKWYRVPEIGSGLKSMDDRKAMNTAILLENQARHMSRLSEATYSSAFGATPENMIRLVRLAYPNSIRDKLFTEFKKAVA